MPNNVSAERWLSGYETGLAEGRQKQPIEERPEQIADTPSIDDHERTTVWIRDVQHESVGWTTQCPAALNRPRARTGQLLDLPPRNRS